jgi:hypothetical protein
MIIMMTISTASSVNFSNEINKFYSPPPARMFFITFTNNYLIPYVVVLCECVIGLVRKGKHVVNQFHNFPLITVPENPRGLSYVFEHKKYFFYFRP